jgi:hypothetical protein
MSLRARLEAKRRVETFYDLAVEDPTAAEEELAAARADLRLLEARADDMPDVAGADAADGLEPARARLTAAEQKLQDCYERIRFAALAPPDFEALIAAHPAGDDAHRWNAATFEPALVAAAAQGDLDEDGWLAFLRSDRCSTGELAALFDAALRAQVRPRNAALPKGSSGTGS